MKNKMIIKICTLSSRAKCCTNSEILYVCGASEYYICTAPRSNCEYSKEYVLQAGTEIEDKGETK